MHSEKSPLNSVDTSLCQTKGSNNAQIAIERKSDYFEFKITLHSRTLKRNYLFESLHVYIAYLSAVPIRVCTVNLNKQRIVNSIERKEFKEKKKNEKTQEIAADFPNGLAFVSVSHLL